MKQLMLFFVLTCGSLKLYAQSIDTLHHYSFQIYGIDNPADAKYVIHDLRPPIGQKLISFDDNTDTFLLKSTQLFVEENLHGIIEENGYIIIE